MSPSLRRLATDWEFWQAMTLGSLALWMLVGTSKFWVMDALQWLAWSLHGVVPGVPQASLAQIRPVVVGFVALCPPVAIGSFCCGFFAFHAEAESRREADGDR